MASALRLLRRDLASAGVDQIARVVAMVDALAERGEADAIVAPLRPRLASYGVVRPLSFTRLLFTPLDTVLIDGAAWRRGAVGVPRTVLRVFSRVVSEGLGAEAPSLAARLAGHTTADEAIAIAEGRALWPRAAPIVLRRPCPPDWSASTGLTETDHQELSRRIALVLDQAAALQAVLDPSCAEGCPVTAADVLAATLAQPQAQDQVALATVLAVVLQRLPRADLQLYAFESLETADCRPTMRTARDLALAFVLHRVRQQRTLSSNMLVATQELQHTAELLRDLVRWAQGRPNHLPAVIDVQRYLAELCSRTFSQAMEALHVPLEAAAHDAGGIRAVDQLEQTIRDLRRFEQAARPFGSDHLYDRAVRRAAARLANAPTLPFMDRVRMVELLAGPDAAMALVHDQPAKGVSARLGESIEG